MYPELNAIQLIPRSFIHCRAKRKSILDIGSRSDWHISVGKLAFDVGESTSYVGELVVGEVNRWRNDRYSWGTINDINFWAQFLGSREHKETSGFINGEKDIRSKTISIVLIGYK